MANEIDTLLNDIQEIENLGNSVDSTVREIQNASRRSKIYIRKQYNQNPFTYLDDGEFSMRGLPIKPEIQILIALRFYATGSFQIVCGDLVSISQATVSRIVKKVSYVLASKYNQFIKFPETEEMIRQVKTQFEKLGRNIRTQRHGLYNIIGAVDCTHIKIIRPRGIPHSEVYRNRKKYFSLNSQVVVGPDMQIFDIVTRWPGSSHDSRIFQNSRVYTKLISGDINGVLVGDGGYPCTRYLLTPINPSTTRPEKRFNYAQIRTRNVIERFFGVWKKRFPCLHLGLRNKLSTTCHVIVACAVLHNISIQHRETITFDDDVSIENSNPERISQRSTEEGLALRNLIVNTQFS